MKIDAILKDVRMDNVCHLSREKKVLQAKGYQIVVLKDV